MQADPQFLALLDLEHDPDGDPATVIGLWPDSRIGLVNLKYVQFAQENGGGPDFLSTWGVGARVLNAVPECLQGFHTAMIRRALETRQVVSHTYECSSATHSRHFIQRLYPLRDAAALLAVHELRDEEPQQRVACAADDARYREADGYIRQCSHCRLVKRLGASERWDFVPAYIAQQQADVSHAICPRCMSHYYLEWDV